MDMAEYLHTLAFRPDETATYYRERPSGRLQGRLFAVMLRSTPPFPAPGHGNGRSRPLAVLCARYAPEGWEWVHPDSLTRQIIGNDLLDRQVVVDRWYFMELHRS